MSTRYGALAVCKAGRLGVVTGSRTYPTNDGRETRFLGVSVNGLGAWESVDPRFLNPTESKWLREALGLKNWPEIA